MIEALKPQKHSDLSMIVLLYSQVQSQIQILLHPIGIVDLDKVKDQLFIPCQGVVHAAQPPGGLYDPGDVAYPFLVPSFQNGIPALQIEKLHLQKLQFFRSRMGGAKGTDICLQILKERVDPISGDIGNGV